MMMLLGSLDWNHRVIGHGNAGEEVGRSEQYDAAHTSRRSDKDWTGLEDADTCEADQLLMHDREVGGEGERETHCRLD
jgi:hypothetical protein